MKQHSCALCGAPAAAYCPADAAHLCLSCDHKVHSANFLVARHRRRLACTNCRSLSNTARLLAGPGSPQALPNLCTKCSDVSSTAESKGSARWRRTATGRRAEGALVSWDRRVEGVLVNWSRRLGLDGSCVDVAADVVGACGLVGLPSRVVMAAAMWYAVKRRRTCGEGVLGGLEACSGVPAKLIVVAEGRIARAVDDDEEDVL